MMAITTRSSINVKPRNRLQSLIFGIFYLRISKENEVRKTYICLGSNRSSTSQSKRMRHHANRRQMIRRPTLKAKSARKVRVSDAARR